MEPHRLRAPSTDGALLAEPPVSAAESLLAANRDRLDDWDHDFQGRPASWLRTHVREEVLALSRRFLAEAGLDPADVPTLDEDGQVPRLVVTGHQPELFHPGVWVKNFATAEIARRTGSIGLNLIVDNDIPKSSSVKVPRDAEGSLRVDRVAFDEWQGEVPYEDLTVGDEGLFASFPRRVREALAPSVADPILNEFWPRALRAREFTANTGLRFAAARRGVEQDWGQRNAEVPLSAVCETDGFLWFACHLLAHLPRFQEVHNEALRRYRELYHIRSRHHPVPALGRQGDWLEAPFWVWRASQPRRRPLLVQQGARSMRLRIAGEDESLVELPLAPDREACCAVERLQELPAQGVRLRTRALTTTMFARYLLGDLFVHGIGGAKYDELGDAVSGRFFGCEPPGYLTMSLTLRLGLNADPEAPARRAAAARGLRDLTYNPDRHLDSVDDPTAARWVAAKHRALGAPVTTHRERLDRFLALRRCNDALQGYVASRRAALLREHAALASAEARFAVARSRDYPAVLHSRGHFRAAVEGALPGLTLADGGSRGLPAGAGAVLSKKTS
jgi:hypothetical protein